MSLYLAPATSAELQLWECGGALVGWSARNEETKQVPTDVFDWTPILDVIVY